MPTTIMYKKGQKLKYVDPKSISELGALTILEDYIKLGKGYCYCHEDNGEILIYVKHTGARYESLIKRIWVKPIGCIQR